MPDPRLRAARERRYDGPVPPGASVPWDYDRPRVERIRNRRDRSWQEVRRLGRLAVHARRACQAHDDGNHDTEWRRLRASLVHALRHWRVWRTLSAG